MFTMVSSSRPEIHIKLEPRCRNVTKQDCVTKWELNSQGRKVWAGNEECRPVTWQKCELEEVPKNFNQASIVTILEGGEFV